MAVVRRVDHVAVLVSDPRPLFTVLTAELGLPGMWEPFEALGWSSGGVSLGNLALETFTPAPGHPVAVSLDEGGIATALEPSEDALAELERREISHGFPFPYQGAPPSSENNELSLDPRVVPPWTTTMLGGFLEDPDLVRTLEGLATLDDAAKAQVIEMSRDPASAATIIAAGTPSRPWLFLCKYHDGKHGTRRLAGRQALREAEGGLLGITGVREIVYSVDHVEQETERWTQLLGSPSVDEESTWRFEDGPGVRLEQSLERTGQRIVCEVESLDEAVGGLADLGHLTERREDVAVVAPQALAGLALWLVE